MAATERRSLKFSRQMRLKQTGEFSRLKQSGKRLTKGCLIANWQEIPEQPHSRLGVITSRRIGGAVVRNRARRLMREAFRLHQHELNQSVDLVLIARKSIGGMKLAEVERDYLTVLKRAQLLKTAES